jgi:Tfp pilus assembly PilM family ATPase
MLAGLQAGGQGKGGSLLSDLPRRITLLLPDTAVRAMVLHLDELPARFDEREALIRWRLGQEQLFPLAGAKVVSQIFHALPGDERRVHTVLTVAIQESVLQQYETLCESVGLIPHEVGITSLRLFDLWRRASGGLRKKKAEFLWANVADRSLTTMVFMQGRPLFYRCKPLGSDAMDTGEVSGLMDKIIEECGASLDVCQQRHPAVVIKQAIICVDGELTGLKTKLEAGLDLSAEQVGWGALERLGLVAKGGHQGMASLAAMAGVS